MQFVKPFELQVKVKKRKRIGIREWVWNDPYKTGIIGVTNDYVLDSSTGVRESSFRR